MRFRIIDILSSISYLPSHISHLPSRHLATAR
jgi:hypothetical protein